MVAADLADDHLLFALELLGVEDRLLDRPGPELDACCELVGGKSDVIVDVLSARRAIPVGYAQLVERGHEGGLRRILLVAVEEHVLVQVE